MTDNSRDTGKVSVFPATFKRHAAIPDTPADRWKSLTPAEKSMMLASVHAKEPGDYVRLTRLAPEIAETILANARFKTGTKDRSTMMAFLNRAPLGEAECLAICACKTDAVKTLGEKERDLADCLASGWDRDEIADELDISIDDVNSGIRFLARKLNVQHDNEIAAMMLVHGIRERKEAKAATGSAPGNTQG